MDLSQRTLYCFTQHPGYLEHSQFFSPVLCDIAYFIYLFALITQYIVTIIKLYIKLFLDQLRIRKTKDLILLLFICSLSFFLSLGGFKFLM